MMQVTLCVVSGNRQTNAIMSSCDLTDCDTKAFAIPRYYTANVDESLTKDAASKVVDLLKTAHEKAGQKVVAAFIVDKPELAFVDAKIKSISNGKKWMNFSDFLAAHGVESCLT
jgi:hypothetical protein